MPKWEYLTVTGAPDWTALGQQGWELAAAVPAGGSVTYIFKRPAPGLKERVTLEQRAAVYRSRGVRE